MSKRETMRAISLVEHGGPKALLSRADIPVPEPGTFEVLIKVGVAGINNTDINTRVGWYSKGDGEAEDASWGGQALCCPSDSGRRYLREFIYVGKGADSRLIGKRVLVDPCLRESNGESLVSPWYMGSECDGGFADYVAAAARHAYPI